MLGSRIYNSSGIGQPCQNKSSKDMQTAVCCTKLQRYTCSAGFRCAAQGLQCCHCATLK